MEKGKGVKQEVAWCNAVENHFHLLSFVFFLIINIICIQNWCSFVSFFRNYRYGIRGRKEGSRISSRKQLFLRNSSCNLESSFNFLDLLGDFVRAFKVCILVPYIGGIVGSNFLIHFDYNFVFFVFLFFFLVMSWQLLGCGILSDNWVFCSYLLWLLAN